MFKLLTEESKIKVAREYALRRLVVAVAAFSTALAVLAAGIFPSYVLSKAKRSEEAAKANAALAGEGEVESSWFSDLIRKLEALTPGLDANPPSFVMEDAVRERGTGIRITELTWSETQGVKSLAVSGIARDRQSLLTYESRLKASGHFSSVALPLSNLARERDISFQIKLTPTP